MLGALSLMVVFVLGSMNATLTMLASSWGPRPEHVGQHPQPDVLLDVNLSAVMPAVVCSYFNLALSALFFPDRVNAPLDRSPWPSVVFIVITAGFSLSLVWLTTVRHAGDRRCEHEVPLESETHEDWRTRR